MIVAPIALTANKDILRFFNNCLRKDTFSYQDEVNLRCETKVYQFFTGHWDFVTAMDLLKHGCKDGPKGGERGREYIRFVKNKKRKIIVATPPQHEDNQSDTERPK